MDPNRWERIQSLFHEAADLPAEQQRARLEALCPDDTTLVDDVLRLLAEDARGDSLVHRELADVAGALLAAGDEGAVPNSVGPYRLLHVLGEGGMGVVYLAERADLDSKVAIKVLRDAWLSPSRRDRFAVEQRTLAKLNHPAIARLYDADILPGGTPWFAMEYVEGQTLTRYCATHPLSVRQKLELFRAVCEAVLHAHQHAVIHRDLKPSNILVTDSGQVKLLDFGIAKQLEAQDGGAERTRTEMRMMTPAYAAPEQVRGGELGVYTDVYSLGVVLYEMLTGRPPFDFADRTPVEVDRILAEREPTKPSSAVRASSSTALATSGATVARDAGGAAWADLDVLCLTAMQKDPARRYRTVDSLIRDIDRYLRHEPLEARPATVGYRLGKFARRNWRPLAAVSAALVVGVGLVTFYTIRLTAARNAAVAQSELTRRIQYFTNSLFQGGDEDAGPSDTLRVVTLLDRGVQSVRELTEEPEVQAALYATIGGIYQSRGDFDRADTLLTTALTARRAHVGRDSSSLGENLIALGLLRAYQSRLDESEQLVREGLGITSRVRPPDLAALARANSNLGSILRARGSYEPAIVALTEAVRLETLTNQPIRDRGATLTELANCLFYSGHYSASDSINRQVIAIDRQLHGDHHPNVASDLINLGAVQSEWGHYAEAAKNYREALAIYSSWFGDDHYETASARTMLGRVLIPQGQLVEARQLLEQALAVRLKVFGPNSPFVASTVNELSRIAQEEGRLDEAEAGYRRNLGIYQKAYDGKHYLIGTALSNLGTVAVDRKDYVGAEKLFREALVKFGETLPPDHQYINIARIRLGRALLRQGRLEEAEKESRAGYEVASKQGSPTSNWLTNARKDLVEEYTALRQPQAALPYQAELARYDTTGKATAAR